MCLATVSVSWLCSTVIDSLLRAVSSCPGRVASFATANNAVMVPFIYSVCVSLNCSRQCTLPNVYDSALSYPSNAVTRFKLFAIAFQCSTLYLDYFKKIHNIAFYVSKLVLSGEFPRVKGGSILHLCLSVF